MNSSEHRSSTNGHSNNDENKHSDDEIDTGSTYFFFLDWIFKVERFFFSFQEILELESALNDIEKAMDKIESQNSTIQSKLRDLLESNRQIAKEFSDIRRNMTNKVKDVTQQLEQSPVIAQDLATAAADTLAAIEQDMNTSHN